MKIFCQSNDCHRIWDSIACRTKVKGCPHLDGKADVRRRPSCAGRTKVGGCPYVGRKTDVRRRPFRAERTKVEGCPYVGQTIDARRRPSCAGLTKVEACPYVGAKNRRETASVTRGTNGSGKAVRTSRADRRPKESE